MGIIIEWFNYCLVVLKSITVSDVIDIIIIAALIYGCIRVIITTKTYFILKGTVLALVLYGIAQLFDLNMTKHLFEKFLQVALVVCVVLFQQEIRHGFEHFSKQKLDILHFFHLDKIDEKNEKTSGMIQSVVDACIYLQKERMGALIVIERNISLSNIIDSGIKIKCEPSSELLGNLFFNKAPLHDGAVIIKDNEIYAAGCILPLTKNINIQSSLGTRHRAGIGMSENSDAIVIIISEETGVISIAENGLLKQGYTSKSLSSRLSNELITSVDSKKETGAK